MLATAELYARQGKHPEAFEVLQRTGYRVLPALTGGDAVRVAALHDGPIDAMLSDVVMPGMSGPEAWAKIVRESMGLDLVQHSFDFVELGGPPTLWRGQAQRVKETCERVGLTLHSTFTGLAFLDSFFNENGTGIIGGDGIRFFNSTINSAFNVTKSLSLSFMIGVIVVGIIWYVAAYQLNRSQGVDVSLAYREIPPE